MDRVLASIVIVPGVVALLLYLVFTYLYQQSRQAYFRAWQIGWGAYCLYYMLLAWNYYVDPSPVVFVVSSLLLVTMTMCIFISTRLMRETFRVRWYDIAVCSGLVLLTLWNLWAHYIHKIFRLDLQPHPHLRV
jgi:hypothetical protein